MHVELQRARSTAGTGVFAGGLLVAVIVLAAGWLFAASACAGERHAAMVIDANSGNVLYARDADAPRHPASLAKMMTLYIAFDLIEQGRLDLQARIRISATAGSAAPSRLGLEIGSDIAVIDAIKALITKSANDIAVALAEHIAGSEQRFASLMTLQAHQLGMSATEFKNASGLPNDEQVTTARDMLTLALHLQDDFPRLYPLFATREFHYNGETHRNHNTLLNQYEGTDGIKTGYTRASGFNVVASVRRGSKHLVGVVFGGTSASSRDVEMQTLMNMTLVKASSLKTRRPSPIARDRPTPERRVGVAGASAKPEIRHEPRLRSHPASSISGEGTALDNERAIAATPEPAISSKIEIVRVHPISLGASPPKDEPHTGTRDTATAGQTAKAAELRPSLARFESAPFDMPALAEPARVAAGQTRGVAPSTLQQQAEKLSRGETSPVPPHPVPAQQQIVQSTPQPAYRLAGPAPAVHSGYHIQIGAYSSAEDAERQLAAVKSKMGALLDGMAPVTQLVQVDGKSFFRARYSGFDAVRAKTVCTELRRLQFDCLVAKGD
jgi:D-alanyl-D-alanine carboxypeptidase